MMAMYCMEKKQELKTVLILMSLVAGMMLQDYLQYSATSANATYHLLMAYRDFPKVFTDEKLANGLDGKNGMADVLDEAKWGLDWLLKMHPKDDWMFNQVGDDRDHHGNANTERR